MRHARVCYACGQYHYVGNCPLKAAGVEHCGLCGLAHFGVPGACPHMKSGTQVRLMLDALRTSTEPQELVHQARNNLRAVLTDLIQAKNQRNSAGTPGSHAHFQSNHSPSITFNAFPNTFLNSRSRMG